jgi:hypothetical protein
MDQDYWRQRFEIYSQEEGKLATTPPEGPNDETNLIN